MSEPEIKTIDDLAKLLGLSKSTVSRALSNNPVIAEETRRRVNEAAKAHRFTRNVSAQRLTQQASRVVAFVTYAAGSACQPSDLFSLEIMGGVAQGLHGLGYEMLVKPVDFRDPDWARKLLASRVVDGFVLMTAVRKMSHIKVLLESKAPFVTWGGPVASYPSVRADDRQGGFLAGKHLAERGAGPVAVLGGHAQDPETQLRLEGFQEGLAAGGGTYDPAYLRYSDYSEAGGRRAMEELLTAEPRPRAVFAMSDFMALGALRAAKALGLSVPGDLAVVGFDDLLVAASCDPPLTTVSQHLNLAGKALAEAIVKFLGSGQVNQVVMPVELVRRGSA